MTETLTKIIVDCATGQVQELPLTAEEIAEREAMAAQAKKEEAARAKEQAAIEAARLSAQEKLAALGLTEAEIQALTA